MIETFPADSLFITQETRASRWAIPYHYEALNCRVENIIVRNPGAFREKTVLDLGCHFGSFAYAALRHGAAHVTGVDTEEALLAKGRWLFDMHEVHQSRFEFREGDALGYLESLPEQSFDTVLCLGIMYYIHDPVRLLRLMRRVAREHIVIDTFTAYYAPCISQEGAAIFESMREATLELPLVLYPFTQAEKGDYTLREHYRRGSRLVGMMALPTVTALEHFFRLLDLEARLLSWDEYARGNRSWRDFADDEVKRTSHWADLYAAKLRVCYILR